MMNRKQCASRTKHHNTSSRWLSDQIIRSFMQKQEKEASGQR